VANEAWEAMFRAQATLAREFEYAGDWGDFPPREYGVLYAPSDGRACRIGLTAQGRDTQRRLGRIRARHVTTALPPRPLAAGGCSLPTAHDKECTS
jgi:hypothetical protein